MNIFLLCSSPGRANGHLCLDVIVTVCGSADGGTAAIVDGFDGGMAIDLDARCRPTRLISRPSAAANGRAPPRQLPSHWNAPG